MPGVKDCDYIPAAPLLEYIEKLGGISRLPGMGVWDRAEKALDGGTGDQETVDRDEREAARFARLESRLKWAKQEGRLSLFTVDAICCEFLQVHPMQVYGIEWFDFGAEITEGQHRYLDWWLAQDDKMGAAA